MSNTRFQRAAGRPSRLALPAVSALAAVLLAACGKAPEVEYERTAELILPVARVELKVVKIEPGKRTGEEIYKAICTSCHASGALGAPRTGEAGDWASRLPNGFEALVASVANGKGAMPAKGGGADLTDTEIERATAYLANTVGAGFTEPPVE